MSFSIKRRRFTLAFSAAMCILLICTLNSCSNNKPGKMLVVTDPASAVKNAAAFAALRENSAKKEIALDSTTDLNKFSEDSLVNYSALVFLGLSPDTLSFSQRVDLQRYSEAGGGVVLLNIPADTVMNWPWFNGIQEEQKKNGKGTNYGSGEHNIYFATIENGTLSPEISKKLQQVADGFPNYDQVKTQRVPENNRFVVEVLDSYMYEPMEMVIFNDGRILYVERRGDIKMYDPKIKKSRVIANFDVSITGNYEDGILGVALDPDFENNRWIYINYSPAGNDSRQNVSRFEMRGDSIIRSTEKIVLKIPTQRETCCHSGGHLTFGPGNNLYISTGDNTSSKESDGFSPIDERAGRAPFDAQKSSGNTHDLRGKILRIHPEPDGTYTIPDGNLFPKDGSKGKPEIYVMGTRNAFRFSVDPKTGYVYWGDVGPDGGVTTERGPESFDEFNQAKKPGNYGWPYFVADNKAYADFDFSTNKIGPKFDPERPENTSPNNTGERILPPAQKPMIWYPYGDSKEFPMLGQGSRSAMAGPVFYYDDFKNAKSKFPRYYDRKLFIYEWARSWVKVVSFDENWNLAAIEPFLPGQEWYKPIDMKFGPDGSLYVLQYGANYFEHNRDSRLVKITYVEGNREPIAKISADTTVGAVPLTVKLSAKGSFDADKNDELKYTWELPGSEKSEINGGEATVTYSTAGIYRPLLKVTDKEGKTSTAELQVRAGNDLPQVRIETVGNQTFYFDGAKLNYSIIVNDKEDGAIDNGIKGADVFVSFDYLKEGKDLALLASNAQLAGGIRNISGKNLLEKSDCKSCHNIKETSIGPSYTAIAARYKGKNVASDLADKIIKGGNGRWGKNMMAAHPQHTSDEAVEMAKYVLAINEHIKGLPVKGSVAFNEHKKEDDAGYYVMRASYTDKGAPSATTLTNSSLLVLRSPRMEAENGSLDTKMNVRHIDGTAVSYVTNIMNNGALMLNDVDLTAIGSIQLNVASGVEGSLVELRIDNKTGSLLGQSSIKTSASENPTFQQVSIPIKPLQGKHKLFLIFKNSSGVNEGVANIDWIKFSNK